MNTVIDLMKVALMEIVHSIMYYMTCRYVFHQLMVEKRRREGQVRVMNPSVPNNTIVCAHPNPNLIPHLKGG